MPSACGGAPIGRTGHFGLGVPVSCRVDIGRGQATLANVIGQLEPRPRPFDLLRFVEDARMVVVPAGHTRHIERLPDGRTCLYFRRLEDGGADLAVAGPRTRAHFKRASGVASLFMLQFKPGWSAPLLGVPASTLTDRIVYLENVWGRAGADLCTQLRGARDLPEAVEHVARAIGVRACDQVESASARLARRAARLLEGGEVRVDRVAEELGVTTRHLRRAFTENIGVRPKEFARSVRLQRAVRMAETAATATDWGHIAAAAGYYDQAHLIGEFWDLVGLTPGAFAKRESGAI
jgi:AraC-like DNA-binding protein